jgi:hypothetical protein
MTTQYEAAVRVRQARRPRKRRFRAAAQDRCRAALEHADTFLQRTVAVRHAISCGAPLNAIERHLDWLDAARGAIGPV